jgi:hypothetical protein
MPREHAAFTNAPPPPILTMSTRSWNRRADIGRPEETETHSVEALRLSPRDTMAYS